MNNGNGNGSPPSRHLLLTYDVLCGRGQRIQHYVGNVTFRRDLILPRLAEYAATNHRTAKSRIAREVFDTVRGVRGRFLERVTEDNNTAPALDGHDRDAGIMALVGSGLDVWREVDDGAALEKVKMTFRNESRKTTTASASASAAAAAAAGEGGSAAAAAAAAAEETKTANNTSQAHGRGMGIGVEWAGGAVVGGAARAAAGLPPSDDDYHPPMSMSMIAPVAAGAPTYQGGDGAAAPSALIMQQQQPLSISDGIGNAPRCLLDEGNAQEKTKQALLKKGGGTEQGSRPTRKRPGPFAREETQGGNDDHFAVASGISSVKSDEMSIAESEERKMPSIPKTEAMTTGENEAYSGMNCIVSPEGSAMPAPFAEDTSSPAQVNYIQGNVATTSSGPTSASDVEDTRSSLLESVRLASERVKNVRTAHDAGRVAYGTNAVDCSDLSGKLIRRDLVSLGSDLFRLFSGAEPFGESEGGLFEVEEAAAALEESSIAEVVHVKKKERRSTSRKNSLLRDLGLPTSLCILISSLLDAEDESAEDRYGTADEVEEDVVLMLANPDRYLFDADADNVGGELVLPKDKLYGREENIASMIEVFDRVAESTVGPPKMVLISGYSGTGKSILVEQFRRPLLQKNGYFVAGKFDRLGQSQPMTVIFDAFNEYCECLSEGMGVVLSQTKEAIQEALGSNANVLTGLIPNLSKVIGVPAAEAVQVEGREAMNRLLFYFRRFVQAISSPYHPVVLFLDDLQWANKESLELVSTIVSDRQIGSLVVVGCYRDNEVDEDHPLTKMVGELALAGVSISNVKLENLDRRSVNALVSDTLHLSPRVTWPLGDIVQSKTNGNPLFVVQLLKSLYNENLLRYSAKSRRWEWDMEAIEAKDIADNVVDLMTRKMLMLGPNVQWLLKVAACLGSRFEPSLLKLLSSDIGSNEWDAIVLLYAAVREGLMSTMGSRYKFSHDQIQQAAYQLIPEGERAALHLHIGKVLWKESTTEELDKVMFIVVDQVRRGSYLLSDHDEEVEVARLCLTAGQKAMSLSSFMQALLCLLQGCMLLHESDWENNYNLRLELFTCCAEAQYATGNPDVAEVAARQTLEHGRCLEDKLRAHYTLLKSLGSLGRLQDTVKHGRTLLAELGEPLPSDPGKIQILFGVAQTRFTEWMAGMEGTAIEGILEKEEMKDPNKLAAMKVLNILFHYTYQAHQKLMALIILRMVKLSLCHGICKESSTGFATYGAVLSAFGQVDQGYRYGKLALSILERSKANELLPSVYMIVHGLINIFKEPVKAGLTSLKRGYEVGMSVGDIEGAMVCTHMYNVAAIHCGCKLLPLLEEVRDCSEQSKKFNHHMLPISLISCQAILNLIGNPEDPTVLTGEAMDQDALIAAAPDTNHLHVAYLYFTRMWLAYLFARYESGAEMAELLEVIGKSRPVKGTFIVNQTLYTGLIAVIMVRDGKGGAWRRLVSETKEKLMLWVQHSSWNYQHKLDLLNAENAYYLNGDLGGARDAYDSSIRAAGEHGFVHEQALACERAGLFCSGAVSTEAAASYFERAAFYYREWGATRKAEDVPKTGV